MKFSFSFRWRTSAGRICCGVYGHGVWTSDDPQKTDWLMKMNSLCSSTPSIAPGVRAWLDRHCELNFISGATPRSLKTASNFLVFRSADTPGGLNESPDLLEALKAKPDALCEDPGFLPKGRPVHPACPFGKTTKRLPRSANAFFNARLSELTLFSKTLIGEGIRTPAAPTPPLRF